jgi:hypothetical protein
MQSPPPYFTNNHFQKKTTIVLGWPPSRAPAPHISILKPNYSTNLSSRRLEEGCPMTLTPLRRPPSPQVANHPRRRYRPRRDLSSRMIMVVALGAAMLVYSIILIQVTIELRQKHCTASGVGQEPWGNITQNTGDTQTESSPPESSTPSA